MSTFVQEFFGEAKKSYEGTTFNGSGYQPKPASPVQVKMYLDLCARKGQKPQAVSSFTAKTIWDENDRLKQLPDVASPAQKEKIRQLHKELVELGADLKPINEEKLNLLTGGRDGQASKLITKWINDLSELNVNSAITDEQLKTLTNWFLCPDIPFESFILSVENGTVNGVKQYKDVELHISRVNILNETFVDTQGVVRHKWTRMTVAQFQEELKSKLTFSLARQFISKYSTQFYEWKKTRITEKRFNMVRTYEKRLMDLHVPQEVITAVDMDENGDFVEVVIRPKTSKQAYYEPVAYTPLDDLELLQMSNEDAKVYIEQLKSELADKTKPKFSEKELIAQELLTEKHSSFNERTGVGLAHDRVTAQIKEFTETQDMIFRIEAVIGYKLDDLHELVQESVVISDGMQKETLVNELYNAMTASIDWTKQQYEVIGRIASLSQVCAENEVGELAIKELYKEFNSVFAE